MLSGFHYHKRFGCFFTQITDEASLVGINMSWNKTSVIDEMELQFLKQNKRMPINELQTMIW